MTQWAELVLFHPTRRTGGTAATISVHCVSVWIVLPPPCLKSYHRCWQHPPSLSGRCKLPPPASTQRVHRPPTPSQLRLPAARCPPSIHFHRRPLSAGHSPARAKSLPVCAASSGWGRFLSLRPPPTSSPSNASSPPRTSRSVSGAMCTPACITSCGGLLPTDFLWVHRRAQLLCVLWLPMRVSCRSGLMGLNAMASAFAMAHTASVFHRIRACRPGESLPTMPSFFI